MKKMLCVASTGMGNVLLYLPVIRSLRKNFPEATIDILVSSKAAFELLEEVREISNIIFLKKKDASLGYLFNILIALRKNRYDMYLTSYLDKSFKVGLLGKILGIPIRIGFKNCLYGALYTKTIGEKERMHEVEYNLGIVSAIGISKIVTDISLKLPEAVLGKARQKLPKNMLAPRIGFHPGSGIELGKNVKRWPIARFAQLADMLAKKNGAEICVFGGAEESQLIHSMVSKMTEHANSFAHQSIKETAALISCCDVFVSNDSGLMHLAAAMKVPVVGIFGPTLWWKNSPWETPHTIVRSELPCAPCYKFSGVSCRDQKCLSEIAVEDVFDAVNILLSHRQ